MYGNSLRHFPNMKLLLSTDTFNLFICQPHFIVIFISHRVISDDGNNVSCATISGNAYMHIFSFYKDSGSLSY